MFARLMPNGMCRSASCSGVRGKATESAGRVFVAAKWFALCREVCLMRDMSCCGIQHQDIRG